MKNDKKRSNYLFLFEHPCMCMLSPPPLDNELLDNRYLMKFIVMPYT